MYRIYRNILHSFPGEFSYIFYTLNTNKFNTNNTMKNV